MYNTILVPIDFSNEENTIQSLIRAQKLSDHGHIVMLHVLDLIPAYPQAELPSDLIDDITPKTHNSLKALADKAEVKAKIEVRSSGAYRKIIQSAEENEVDLILINSHQPGLQDYLLGSTAAKVVRHAKCAVLVER